MIGSHFIQSAVRFFCLLISSPFYCTGRVLSLKHKHTKRNEAKQDEIAVDLYSHRRSEGEKDMGSSMDRRTRTNAGSNFKNRILGAVFTLLLLFACMFCISGTVISQEKGKSKVEKKYYHQIEQAYVKEIRAFLNDRGYKDSGVTMTYILKEDGSRDYTVMIHHKRIEKLGEKEKKDLLDECRQIEFPVEDCGFCHTFLETDL